MILLKTSMVLENDDNLASVLINMDSIKYIQFESDTRAWITFKSPELLDVKSKKIEKDEILIQIKQNKIEFLKLLTDNGIKII